MNIYGNFERGDIFIVEIENHTGREMAKTRPAVLVSNDLVSASEGIVLVAFCTTQPQQHDLPSHVLIRTTGEPSTVLCEHVYAVDKSRIRSCVGSVTQDELQRIDRGLSFALGLDFTAKPVKCASDPAPASPAVNADVMGLRAQLDAYKCLCSDLLDRLSAR